MPKKSAKQFKVGDMVVPKRGEWSNIVCKVVDEWRGLEPRFLVDNGRGDKPRLFSKEELYPKHIAVFLGTIRTLKEKPELQEKVVFVVPPKEGEEEA